MNQQKLKNFEIDDFTEKDNKLSGVILPNVIAICTECSSILDTPAPMSFDGNENGAFMLSCRVSDCGDTASAGSGRLRIELEDGEINEEKSSYNKVNIVHLGTETVHIEERDGVSITDPKSYEEVTE